MNTIVTTRHNRPPQRRLLRELSPVLTLLLMCGGSAAQSISQVGPTYNVALAPRGTVVVGEYGTAFRWTQSGGLVSLGVLPGATSSEARSASADGSVVVGSCDFPAGWRAFRWTAGAGMTDLGVLPGFNSWAIAVSADGSAIVGASEPHTSIVGYRWTAATGAVSLGTLPGGQMSNPRAISGDGSVVTGYADNASHVSTVFRWTVAGGMAALAPFPGGASSYSTAISRDGAVIVGGSQVATNLYRAFRWTPAAGMENLVLDIHDFICFLNRFASGDSYANCDRSTAAPTLNILDFTCFMNAYTAGCP